MIPGARGGESRWLRFVDVREQYGRHVVDDLVRRLPPIRVACDVGTGGGDDLLTVRRYHPAASLVGIDCDDRNRDVLATRGIELHVADLERDSLPMGDEGADLIIANQVFEHVKELFWITHQLSAALKVGGHLLIGIPNLGSLHNRILFALGGQPTQLKSYSAHVRGFVPREIPRFLEVCFPGGYRLERLAGAQFYPFPRPAARLLARAFPSLAFSVFYLLRKQRPYAGEILRHPVEAGLETNFYLGPGAPR